MTRKFFLLINTTTPIKTNHKEAIQNLLKNTITNYLPNSKIMKYLLSFIALLSLEGFAQSTIANPQNLTEEKFKSPQVHLLKQFADYPVDLSRGLVDINVPIYDLPFAGKTLPIKLMFHPSGLKADVAENGMLGLKWALNTSGFISREVRGYPDEQRPHKQGINQYLIPDWKTLYGGASDKGYFNNNIIYQDLGLQHIGLPAGVGTYEDTEYDIFTFSLPTGQSGKFILKDDNGNKSASFMPYKPYKLNNPSVGNGYDNKFIFSKFEIVDDEGYIYTFGKSDVDKYYYEYTPDFDHINTWHLTSITSPNKKDVIKFEYIFTVTHTKSPLVPVIINDQLDNFDNYFSKLDCPGALRNSLLFSALESTLYDSGGYFVRNYNEPTVSNNDSYYISKISYNNLNINFSYKKGTGDINELILNKIEITNNNNIIRQADFDVKLTSGPSYLKSINIKGSATEIIEKYEFDYYNLDKIPNVNKLSNSADYWGYYNSKVENVIQKDTAQIYFMYPSCRGNISQLFLREIGSGQDRYSSLEDMKIGMVKSITYPTGGTSTFDYESNKYKDITTKECGGLRILNIIDRDKNGRFQKKREFTYGENEDGIGQIPSYLKPDTNIYNAFEEKATTYYIRDTNVYWDGETGTPYFAQDYGHGTFSTRYIKGFFPGYYYTFLNNLVSYSKVTEYVGDINNNNGKIENYYETNTPARGEYIFDTRLFKFQKEKLAIDPSNYWYGNNIYKKIEFKKENNGTYFRVKQTDYSYVPQIADEFYDLSIFKFKDFIGFDIKDGKQSIRTSSEELEQVIQNPGSFFGYKVQKYTIGVENLNRITEEIFFNDGTSIVQTTTNTFDNKKPAFIKETKTLTSRGENIAQKFLYPFNINTGVYSQMSDANIISPLIEKVSLKNDKVTSSTLLTYKKSDNNFVPAQQSLTELNIPVPYSGFTNFNGSVKDTRYSSNSEITYDLYDDYGNPIQITSKGKITTCFVWGYDKKYPIAKIENATYSTGLPNSITNAQQTLITNAIAASAGENTKTTEINLISKLKLLRDGFPDAMVTTYTYDPLIGITSATDPKEYTTYYEYDTYSRLKQIKDKEEKILSVYKYNYTN